MLTNLIRATATLCLARIGHAQVTYDSPLTDYDLFSFVTRPDLRPPKYNITTYTPLETTPGYIFVAPYTDLLSRSPSRNYEPSQVGPAIYDQQGDLIWSGAHIFGNRATFDFKPSLSTPHLSFIVKEDIRSTLAAGAGIVLDDTYTIVSRTHNSAGRGTMNMHEFSIDDERGTALMITFESKLIDVSEEGKAEEWRWMGNNGFVEVDVVTGEVMFEWWALDHVDVGESLMARPPAPGSVSNIWDFFHLNSIDKDAEGDYIISARYPSTIYKISHLNGTIIWRLGGTLSSFAFTNSFSFSSQHNARVIAQTPASMTLSFLNNAADGTTATANTSSAMIVALNTEVMTATLVQSFPRPDGGLSELRGNVQILESGHAFVGWSENGYISEFNNQGTLLQTGQFASHRFVTYRAYKFNFTGHPVESPVLIAKAYGPTADEAVSALYVSWNGATEVVRWRFKGGRMEYQEEGFETLDVVERKGFETVSMIKGIVEFVFAEAIGRDGSVLGRTKVERVSEPDVWWEAEDQSPWVDESDEEFKVEDELREKNTLEGSTINDESDEENWEWSQSFAEPLKRPMGVILFGCLSISLGVGMYACARRRSRGGFKPLINEFDGV